MLKKLLILLIAYFTFSCQNDTKNLILGEWISVERIQLSNPDMPPPPQPLFGNLKRYEFFNNGKCDFRPGYYDYEKFFNGNSDFLPYLGTESDYTISGDEIKIFNPIEKQWDKLKIKSLTKDTLIIGKDSNWTTYVKKHYKLENIPDFDAVIVSASPCYGRCPSNDIVIDWEGNVSYHGINHNIKNGYYNSKISTYEFDKIVKQFKKADYIHLEKEYYTTVTDHSTISLAFVKDGKIVKSIFDYAGSSPLDFQWAYIPLVYYSQQLKLTREIIPPYLQLHFRSSFETAERILEITDAESYFLFNKLKAGKDSDNKFEERYSLDFVENDVVNKIMTDGRYYKFYLQDKTTKTVDIGFDFLSNQNIINQFKDKPDE